MLRPVLIFCMVGAVLGLSLSVFGCSRHRRGPQAMVAQNVADGWKLLGKRTAHGRSDRDQLPVTYSEGKFTRIKFEVTGSKLELYNVVIVFGNGDTYSPDTRMHFSKGSQTRVIDLPGGERVIKSVRFHYGNLPGGGKAHVAIFAR